jgi:hypothetical protein
LAIAFMGMASQTLAVGYWNMPGSFCQCIGCGFGGGYHAPLVLGPVSCDGWLGINERRLPYPPTPYSHTPSGHPSMPFGLSPLSQTVLPTPVTPAPVLP